MPKSSSEQIDADEKKVLRVLQKNSKESIDTIAKQCKFSRQKVWRIIKRLEKNTTIWGYSAVVDMEKLDRKRYIMLIKRSNQPAGDAIQKIVRLTAHTSGEKIGVDIISSCYLHGNYDWMMIFTAIGIKEAKKFAEVLSEEYSQIISEIALLEDIFTVKACNIVNPNVEKFQDLF